MAKYMLIMRATDESFAKFTDVDFTEAMNAMGKFNDELIQAGVLLAAEGLDDAKEGVVVDFTGEQPVVTDGPYGETKELFNGFYLLDVASKEEAIEWAKRAPMTAGHQDRNPPGARPSTSSRRTTNGSRRNAPGASKPASSDRAALTGCGSHRGEGRRRGCVADGVCPHRRRPGALHRRLPTGRGPGAGGTRRGARLLVRQRDTCRTGRLAAYHRPPSRD